MCGTARRTTRTARVKDKVGVVPLPGFTRRQARDLHRRLAGRGDGVLEEQGGGREARAVPLDAGSVEDAGDPRLSPAGLRGGLHRTPSCCSVNPWFKDALPVVQTARARPVTRALHRGLGGHPHQHERVPGRNQDARTRRSPTCRTALGQHPALSGMPHGLMPGAAAGRRRRSGRTETPIRLRAVNRDKR